MLLQNKQKLNRYFEQLGAMLRAVFFEIIPKCEKLIGIYHQNALSLRLVKK